MSAEASACYLNVGVPENRFRPTVSQYVAYPRASGLFAYIRVCAFTAIPVGKIWGPNFRAEVGQQLSIGVLCMRV